MGLSPEVWGREAWHFIHLVALTYPPQPSEQQKKEYLLFFESLGNTLPCEICAAHYREKIKNTPPKLENHNELFNWTVDIHNSVNKDNGKKQYTYKQALEEINKNMRKPSDYLVTGVAVSVSIITMISLFAYSINKFVVLKNNI
jgi:hypothetical protein